jgi:NTP pyrophosphatase (non-canonical NTP hydrolase)
MITAEFITLFVQELVRAREKFPCQDIWTTLSALTEEVGELNKAVLQHNFEPHKGVTENDILNEAVQVAVMAARVILDCQQKYRTDLLIAALRSELRHT